MGLTVQLELDEQVTEAIAKRAAAIVLEELEARSTNGAAPEFLSVEEAAELIRAKPQRIYDLCTDGRLERVKDGSRVLIRRAELLAYLAGEATGAVAHRLPTSPRSRTGTGVAR